MDEEESRAWFPRIYSKFQCRHAMHDDLGYPESWWRYSAKPGFMRPFSRDEDCPAPEHPIVETKLGEFADPHDDCQCYREEEGWHYTCKASHPDAIPVWRLEAVYPPRFWYLVRNFPYRVHLRRRSRFVLWGGRVQRQANRFERRLYRGILIIRGDIQLRPGMGQMGYCQTCGVQTLGYVRKGRWNCMLDGHLQRSWAKKGLFNQ